MLNGVKNKIAQISNAYWGVDSVSAIKSSGYLLLGQIVGNIMSLVVMIVAGRYLSKETFGTYRSVIALVSLVSIFSLSGLSTAITRSVAKGFDQIFLESFKRQIMWSVGSFLAVISIGIYHYTKGEIPLGLSFIVAAFFFPLINSAILYKSYLNGKKKYKALAWTNILISITTSTSLIMVMILDGSLVSISTCYYASNTVITLCLFVWVRKNFNFNKKNEEESKNLHLHLSVMNILDSIANQIDKVLLFYVLGPVSVSIYTFAVSIPEQLRNIIKFIPQIALPRIANQTIDESKRKAMPIIGKLFLLTIPLSIIYILLAPFVMKLFFPEYPEAIIYSQIFALIIIFDNGISGVILKAHNAIRELYTGNIFIALLKISMVVVGGIFFGLLGVVMSRIFSRVIGFFMYLYLTKKYLAKNNEV